MSKKFFSLIHEGAIHLAPDVKVISASAISTLSSAEEVLQKVQEDAKQYRLEIAAECEKEKEQAQKEGYEEGFQEWIEHIATLEQEIQETHQKVQKMVIPIALKAAKKIVGRELEISNDAVVDIVSNSLKSVAQHKKIRVFVNREDLLILEKNREQLKTLFEALESFSIRERDDIEPGGCMIETEGGIINAQLSNQWQIMENAFQKLMQQQASEK